MSDWSAWLGRTERTSDVLTSGLIGRFRATIDGDADGHDDHAPPGIHWCLCLPDARTDALGADGHPLRSEGLHSFMPPMPLPRRMWASSSVAFLSPLQVGAHIVKTSTIRAITEKEGASGRLIFVEVDHLINANGIAAIEEHQSIVFRAAATLPPSPRPHDAALDGAAWDWHRTLQPSAALLFRYSALTFNSHRIHYDLPYATGEEGYRGLVVHGPLMATLLLDLAARALDTPDLRGKRVQRFSFRGLSPAIAGEALHLVGRREGDAMVLSALGSDQRVVMAADAAID